MNTSAGPAAEAAVPISQLKPGHKGTVVRLDGESGLRQHLLEMGFTKGTEVEFVRQAPLGDPVDLRLRGYRLSLRRVEASVVLVNPETADDAPARAPHRTPAPHASLVHYVRDVVNR